MPYKTYHTYRGEKIASAKDARAVISLGTPISALVYHEHDHLRHLYKFYEDAVKRDLPLIGSCFGGQLLAKVLGAEVKRNPVKEIGIYKVKLTEAGREDRLFGGFDDEFPIFLWHTDVFTIPPGGVRLAENKACSNQAFRKGNSVGMLFHLESNRADISVLCNNYASELIEENLNPRKIIEDFNQHADEIKRLNYKLLTNFFDNI
jgi:GMP synthase (glutamine-hydrolysing)